MKTHSSSLKRGFTLLETVIAIGVLAVLLTGFMIVFAPAAAGIKKSINLQEADRLASAMEQELVTMRPGNEVGLPAKTPPSYTGFDKAFEWIKKSNLAGEALLAYQYRGSLTGTPRADGTPEPEPTLKGKKPGEDYILQSMVRRKSDTEAFKKDLPAVEGGVYLVKCTQLVFDTTSGELKLGTPGTIVDPKGAGGAVDSPEKYPDAVIAFSAEFFSLPAKSAGYFDSATGFAKTFSAAKNPVFTRNLAVRR